ncbi:FAD-dependent oxidoreductase [Clostridium perfringens]|uniref:Pyridine nucleotide-disulphide oxidoreductase n=3 Tax=Clostridium perfringens TaxID=1502 RepID=A0A0H2YT72_CLOP1|nr:FAD-dependent oxidoreductase [Clostridium perfringens]ABG84244.1 pyridine nucleotide-disulphide oxidoreductase [Clostridium perfringens ATCC 13124]ALG47796.1 putative monooxygenase [Clostridium perfringens]EDT16678.1 putative oxidoreductase [Clostridium perfringens E str. JGS1987]EHK2388375.1 NAD(P)/FAD-dependent oxidoreductase [Clostridium perfringens]EHK2403169.1 NAD(P)/FAD-dependent oxidoreductase [Clostridium perfringens]
MREYDLIIIGGGASGLLLAINGKKDGIKNILLVEKDPILGGALNSADYNISEKGNLTGIEYKESLLKEFNELNIDVKLNTMVLKIEDSNEILCTSSEYGVEKIKGKNIIITNGGKEKSRNAVQIPGDRTAGVLTVGMAKKIFGIKNMVPGKNIFIVGDSTLYMIQEDLKKHNIKVSGIITDKNKNEVFDLSENLYPGYEIVSIHGEGRVSSVTIKNDDEKKNIKCDTVIFAYPMISDGLVALRSGLKLNPSTTGPAVDENLETSSKNIYACGNAIYIHKSIEEIEDECKKLIKTIS